MDKFEELKMYKELLDNEILTQEEFDAKKKEILDQPAELAIIAESQRSNTQQGTPRANNTGQSVSLSTKATSVLSYISLIFWLVAYLIGDKEGAKFHLNQSLVINLAMLLCAIPVLGWIWAIFMLVVWVMGLVYAIREEEKEVPLLGKVRLLS